MLGAQALAFQVQELTGRVQTLTAAHSSWNTWSVRFVAFTAVVAALYFVAQWMTNKRGNELSEAQATLIQAKDEQARIHNEQVANDLRDKDLQIAATQRDAKRIETEAQEREAKLKADAEVKIAEAHAIGEQANERAGQANQRTEGLRQQNLATESRLEEERRTRVELEASLAPRVFNDQGGAADRLKAAGEINVMIESVADFEAWRTAGQIAFTLSEAGWKILEMKRTVEDNFFDGVSVETQYPAPRKRVQDPPLFFAPNDVQMSEAARLLVSVLNDTKIAASQRLGPMDVVLPPKTLLIRVGLKPQPYFLSKEVKELREESERVRRREEEWRKENRERGVPPNPKLE